MILTIDIGNTCSKFAVIESDTGDIIFFDHLSKNWKETYSELTQKYGDFSKVCISNVAGPQPELESILEENNTRAYWIKWNSEIASKWFTNIPEGLGADRLAADIGARTLVPQGSLLVVDAGTCITYDVIDSDNSFIGGSISPGIRLRLLAMHEHTASLPLITPDGFAPVIATEIVGSLRGGATNGVRWEIEGYTRELLNSLPNVTLLYTGGVPMVFSPEIEKHCIHDPYLVLRGLWRAYKDL